MHHFRDVIVRLRSGQSERKAARAARMGRDRVAQIRDRAKQLGWLEPDTPMPSDEEVAREFEREPEEFPAQMVSLVEPFRDKVANWVKSGVQAITIWKALQREHDFSGGYNSVKRFCRQVAGKLETVEATAPMLFDAGDVGQVDFGSGPLVPDSETGKLRKTWIFVMTLAFSRHMYAELVWDQSVPTWLRCHRNAFEFFGGVVRRVMLDYVARHIIQLMCPTPLCGQSPAHPAFSRRRASCRTHNGHSEFSHASRFSSSRQTGFAGCPSEAVEGGSQRRSAASLARMLISA